MMLFRMFSLGWMGWIICVRWMNENPSLLQRLGQTDSSIYHAKRHVLIVASPSQQDESVIHGELQ